MRATPVLFFQTARVTLEHPRAGSYPMKSILTVAMLLGAATGACNPSSTSPPPGGSNNAANGNASNAASTTNSTGVGGGGATTTAGPATGAGAASSSSAASGTSGGPVTCSNSDSSTLPIDETGWVARECNSSGIQGAWYCYADPVAPTDCSSGMAPYRAGSGMCISGETIMDETYAAWGAGIGLSLNETGEVDGAASVKSAYNASMNGVAGFQISITGTTGEKPIRVGFTGAAEDTGLPSPFWEVPGPGDYTVMLADAVVPAAWEDTANAGEYADPTSIFDMQIQVVGGGPEAGAPYDFCIASVTPVGEDGGVIVGDMPSPYGSQVCGRYDTIALGNQYTIQNNVWNDNTAGSQCISALWNNGDTAGFVVSPSGISIDAEIGPASYPSIVLGWHYGQFHGSYTSPRALSSLTSIPSAWSYTVPTGSESYNVSYDLWIHSNAGAQDPQGSLELMIWTNHRDTVPIGSIVAPSITVGGASWEVWYGQNSRGWNTVSYVNIANPTSISLDVAEFINEAITRGYASGSDYLLGVQAGFEIWRSSVEMRTNSYTISIN